MSEHRDVVTGFPAFAVTVDLVALTIRAGALHVLLVRRGEDPFEGQWALPGGFVREHESLHDAALRELHEETGVAVEPFQLEQVGAFGDPDRDPRQRVVTIAWLALLPEIRGVRGGGDAAEAALRPVSEILDGPLPLAFDHETILDAAVRRVRRLVERTDAALDLCGEEFTISELRRVYEALWDTRLDPSNFHRMAERVLRFARATDRKSDSTDKGGRRSSIYRRPGRRRNTLPMPLLHPDRRSSKPRRPRRPERDPRE